MLRKAAEITMATLRLARPAARLAAPATASHLLAVRRSARAGGLSSSPLLAERLQNLHTWVTVAAAAQPAIASSVAASTAAAEDTKHLREKRRYAVVNFYHVSEFCGHAGAAGSTSVPLMVATHGVLTGRLTDVPLGPVQLVDIERPHEVINQHKEWMAGRDVRGRIYISEQVRPWGQRW